MTRPPAPRPGDRLFAYGTLQAPAVVEAVCGRALAAAPATLPGYARYRVRGEAFPGIVPQAGASTDGVLLTVPDRALWDRIDGFETDFYERVRVRVVEGSAQADAWTYVVRPRNAALLTSEGWSVEAFMHDDLPTWLPGNV